MRPALVVLALLLAGCSEPDAPAAPADPEALRLLDAVDRDALSGAFARARGLPVTVEVTTWRGDGAPDTSVPDPVPPLRDPLAAAIPDDPPYVDPAVRDAYRLSVVGDTTVGGARFRLVEAVLVDSTRELAVRRVRAAVQPETRAVGAVEVERRSGSAIYDETSRVRVDLAPGPDGWTPQTVVTDTRTDVPLSEPARVRLAWRVGS